ncbi:mediator complex subunit Med5-domain-containing protein [Suillus fuscotomentosus]|uniref:Mediator of RNA polymerase II transcription subunit 5 n=1 Tax=Suillus fuscotomentosus TaxID=1912939 RepID=A0AAD4HKU8_9AGAM|nr:mediator complex subunit Med5-domain-containing protein [Suillus fuscotomentosus]KAG1899144.1 mediator complex subunit Med5-domain-containing protein [Suillus fuscotomentosus]
MSLAELTRNSFQCGVSPQQWLGLCKLLVQQHHVGVDFSTAISNTILELYRLYPADPTLREYLQLALSDGLLSNAVFVSTFIRAARDPELQNGSTLDMLCRLALNTHYTSGSSPAGSIIPLADSQVSVLSKVQDALALLRIAHSLPPSNFHQLIVSASELAILLLSCVTDMSQLTAAQAMIYLGDANDVLQSLRLSQELRQVLEGFVLSLSLLMGDDAKAIRDAQMLHAMQLTMGKNDVHGVNGETDTVTCGLLLQSLVACRTCDFGAGSDLEAVAVMTGTLRWTSWAPNVFCTQLLVAALTCVAQSSAKDDHESSFSLWRAFVVGRLPRLLFALEKSLEAHGTTEADWRAAMHAALLSLSQRSDLLAQCDAVARQGKGLDSSQDNNTTYRSLIREFIQQLLAVGIIEYAFAVSMDPMMVNDPRTRLQSEAFDHGCSIETYLDSKLTLDSDPEDTSLLLEKIHQEPGSHYYLAAVVQKRFTSHSTSLDLEHLSHLTRTLYHHDFALDILSLHLKISNLICNALEIISEYDCETVGDPQTAVSHLGDIVLFAEMVLAKFRISSPIIKDGKMYRTELLRCTSRVYQLDELSLEHKSAFATWYKAIFDSNSEGIDDALLRTTKPQILLQISATLFSQAALARHESRLDNDTLQTGMSYFLGPLLRWTLVGVIHAMLFEIGQRALIAPLHLAIVQTILCSPHCPIVVRRLCSPSCLRLLSSRRIQAFPQSPVLDISVIRATCFQTLGVNKDPSCKALEDHQISPATRWMDFPKQEIHEALALARRHKAPRIDVTRCLSATSPSTFLNLLWSELSVASSLGEMETCRRLATFVLAMPRQLSSAPPLLPIFMYNVLPYLITAIDQQQATEKGMNTQLLVTIISSALTAALHIEWAVQTVCEEQRFVLGQPSAAIARRLAADLRAQKHGSSTSATILQRLGSSPAFVTNFPVFVM